MGARRVVKHLKKGELSTKLLEMGLVEGQQVEVLFKAPFGDPIAVSVGDYVLSLRLEEAEWVEVAHP
jgi:Fe2+ transport system protein FeoA